MSGWWQQPHSYLKNGACMHMLVSSSNSFTSQSLAYWTVQPTFRVGLPPHLLPHVSPLWITSIDNTSNVWASLDILCAGMLTLSSKPHICLSSYRGLPKILVVSYLPLSSSLRTMIAPLIIKSLKNFLIDARKGDYCFFQVSGFASLPRREGKHCLGF